MTTMMITITTTFPEKNLDRRRGGQPTVCRCDLNLRTLDVHEDSSHPHTPGLNVELEKHGARDCVAWWGLAQH